MFYTQILYDQENHGGNIINSVTDALSYDDYTIPTLFYDSKTYAIALENQESNSLSIKARMLFRPFSPDFILNHHPSFIENLPIYEMSVINSIIEVE